MNNDEEFDKDETLDDSFDDADDGIYNDESDTIGIVNETEEDE